MSEIVDKRKTFLCGIDGSEPSNFALEAAIELLHKGQDHLSLYHAYSESMEAYVPVELHFSALKETIKTMCENLFSPAGYSLWWEELGKRTVHSALMDACKTVNPDFIVLGYRGRVCFDLSATVKWGSTADATIRHSGISCVVVKHELPLGPKKYVYCVKDSQLCRAGLDLLLTLLKSEDTLTILFIYEKDVLFAGEETLNCDGMRTFYEQKMAGKVSAWSSFKSMVAESSRERSIIQLTNEMKPDICCLAPRLRFEAETLAERVIKSVDASVIILRPQV